jgi:hypothetical protein
MNEIFVSGMIINQITLLEKSSKMGSTSARLRIFGKTEALRSFDRFYS